jgi:signal peptidase II
VRRTFSETRHRRVVLRSLVAVVFIDAATKSLAVRSWSERSIDIGPARMQVLRNPGGPFGFAPHATVWFTVLAIGVLPLVVRAASHLPSRAGAFGIGLVLGGVVGNLADRILRSPGVFRGAVVDWLHVTPYGPTFNLADVALRVGSVLLLVAFLHRAQITRVATSGAAYTDHVTP